MTKVDEIIVFMDEIINTQFAELNQDTDGGNKRQVETDNKYILVNK